MENGIQRLHGQPIDYFTNLKRILDGKLAFGGIGGDLDLNRGRGIGNISSVRHSKVAWTIRKDASIGNQVCWRTLMFKFRRGLRSLSSMLRKKIARDPHPLSVQFWRH